MSNSYQSQVDAAKSALDAIKTKVIEVDTELLKVISTLNKLNNINTPSAITISLQNQANLINQLNTLLSKQQTQVSNLSQAKSNLNQKTSDEIINQRALAKSSDLQAKAQSKLVGAYQNLVAKQQQAKKTLQDLIVAQGKNSSATKKAQLEYDKLAKKVNQANKATSNFSNSGLGGIARGFRNLIGAFGIIGGVQLFAGMIKSGFELTRKLDSLNYTMRAVIENSETLQQTQFFLTDIADKYGASIVTLTERYNKFYTAARQSGVSLQDTEAIFSSFTKSAGFLGLKAHELEGIFLALEQMLSKGKVTTEELRRQLGERLPGAFGVMADTVNKLNPDIEVTVDVLDQMLKKGEILSAEVLPEFAKQYEKAIGVDQKGRVETLNSSIERMTNSWVAFIGAVTTGDGVLSKVLRGAADYIGLVVKGLEYMAKGTEQNQAERNYGIYNNILKEQTKNYKELGDEADEYAKIDKKRSTETLERLRKEKSDQENIMVIQEKKLGILKFSNKAYTEAATKSDRLTASIAREEAVLEAANRQLTGYVEKTEEASKKGRTLSDVISDIKDAQEELKNSTKDEAPAILDRIDALEKEKEAWERLNDKRKKNIDYIKGSLSYLEAQVALFEAQQKNLATNNREWGIYQEKIDEAKKALNDFNIALEGVSELKISGDLVSSFEKIKEILTAPKKIEGLEIEGASKEIENNIEQAEKLREHLKAIKEELEDFRGGFADEFFSEAGFDFTGEFLMNFDKITYMLEQGGDKWEDYFNLITEMGQEAYNFIAQASQQNFDAEYERLEKQKEIALQFAGESDAAKQRIEEQYEARRKVIQARQAKAQKEQAIVNTTINTAQAIMQIWAHSPDPTGISQGLMTAIIAGIGAAQVAIIASQKIPEFFRGTMNAPEGLALVDEKQPEVHTDRHGRVKSYGNEGGANYRFLNQGDKIYKSREMYFEKEFRNVLNNNDILPYTEFMGIPNVVVQDKGVSAGEMDSIIGKHFSKIQTNVTSLDKNGLRTYVKNQGGKTELLNNRVTFKGYNV